MSYAASDPVELLDRLSEALGVACEIGRAPAAALHSGDERIFFLPIGFEVMPPPWQPADGRANSAIWITFMVDVRGPDFVSMYTLHARLVSEIEVLCSAHSASTRRSGEYHGDNPSTNDFAATGEARFIFPVYRERFTPANITKSSVTGTITGQGGGPETMP